MKFTVIIPSYRRADNIGRRLEEFSLQTHTDFELLIVVDSPEQEFIDAYKSVTKTYSDLDITLLVNPENLGSAETRNRGIENASGDHLILLDDDISVKENYLEGYADVIERYPDSIIIGNIEHRYLETPFQKYIKDSRTYFGFQGLTHLDTVSFPHFITGNVCAPRDTLRSTTFEQVTINGKVVYGYEDLVFGYTLSLKGHEFIFNNKSTGEHEEYTTLSELSKKKYEAGKASVLLARQYPELAEILHYNPKLARFPIRYIPPKSVYSIFDSCIGIFSGIFPSARKLYRYVLAASFVAGVSYAFESVSSTSGSGKALT